MAQEYNPNIGNIKGEMIMTLTTPELILFCMPLLGYIICYFLLADGRRAWADSRPMSDTPEAGLEKSKFMVLLVSSACIVVYGLLEAFLLANRAGRVSIELCLICGACGLVGAVLYGIMGREQIKKGGLTPERFSKMVNLLIVPGLLPLAGLLLFFFKVFMR
jgi:phosphate/sulfate permease